MIQMMVSVLLFLLCLAKLVYFLILIHNITEIPMSAKSIMGQYIMIDPTSLFSKNTKEYIEHANLDPPNSVGRILDKDDAGELYNIRWINKLNTIIDKRTDSDLLYKSGNFHFFEEKDVDKVTKRRLLFEKPLELPDVEPEIPVLADLFDTLTFNNPPPPPPPPPQSLADIDLPKITNLGTSSPPPPPPPPPPLTRKGGKKSRKNRKSVKGGKSRKAHKKFCKSRKLRKSRNVRKTRRR
jgi:hypothetical protein